MNFEQPQSRNEAILQNMLGAQNELVPPQSRIEALLQAILEQGTGGQVTTDKIADGAVTNTKIADKAIDWFKLNDELKAIIDNKAEKPPTMKLLCSRTVIDTGETLPSIYTFNQDDNGNAFNLSMAQVVVYVPSGQNQGGSIGFYKNDNRTGLIYQYSINNIRQTSANSWFDIKTEIQNGFWTSTPKGTSEVFLSTGAPKTELTAESYKIKLIDVTTWGSSVIPAGSVIKIYGINEVTA